MKNKTFQVYIAYGEVGSNEAFELGVWKGQAANGKEAEAKALEALWDERLTAASCAPRFVVHALKKFEVSYRLTYDHVVTVGIEASSEDEAIAKAEKAFNEGRIWDDTKDMPLLHDEYEEHGDNIIEFTAEVVNGETFTVTDAAKTVHMHRNAVAACHALLDGNPEDAKRLARQAFSLI